MPPDFVQDKRAAFALKKNNFGTKKVFKGSEDARKVERLGLQSQRSELEPFSSRALPRALERNASTHPAKNEDDQSFYLHCFSPLILLKSPKLSEGDNVLAPSGYPHISLQLPFATLLGTSEQMKEVLTACSFPQQLELLNTFFGRIAEKATNWVVDLAGSALEHGETCPKDLQGMKSCLSEKALRCLKHLCSSYLDELYELKADFEEQDELFHWWCIVRAENFADLLDYIFIFSCLIDRGISIHQIAPDHQQALVEFLYENKRLRLPLISPSEEPTL